MTESAGNDSSKEDVLAMIIPVSGGEPNVVVFALGFVFGLVVGAGLVWVMGQ